MHRSRRTFAPVRAEPSDLGATLSAMARAHGVFRRPLDHVIAGEWPHGQIDGNVAAAVVQRMAAVLVAEQQAIGGRQSQRALARRLNAKDTTIGAIINGTRWPDLVTVINISATLRQNLLQITEVLLSDPNLRVFTKEDLLVREQSGATAPATAKDE